MKNNPHIGFGVFLPEHILDNQELESRKIILTNGKILSSEQLKEKIGVERRHLANPTETVARMGWLAAAKALNGHKAIDLIIVSTSHPTQYHAAGTIRDHMNLKNARVLDIHAACTGSACMFAYIHNNLKKLQGKKILMVATEKFSNSVIDLLHKDAMELDKSLGQTIFGDGAAAVSFTIGRDIITRYAKNAPLPDPKGKTDLIFMAMGNNQFREPCIIAPVACSPRPRDFPDGYFTQDGPGVYGVIQSAVPAIVRAAVDDAGYTPEDIDLVILHPGSKRLVDALRTRLEPDFHIYSDYADGNMSSVSLLYSFIKALKEERIGKGSKVVLCGFGAGSPDLYSSTVIIELKSSY